MYQLINLMQKHFGLNYVGPPRTLKATDTEFLSMQIEEGVDEYRDAYNRGSIADQFEALIVTMESVMIMAEKQGFPLTEGLERLITSKLFLEKIEGTNDLKAPEGWRPAYFSDLLQRVAGPAQGIFILDGPDGCGKTTLGKFLEKEYGAYYMHCTWTEGLDKRMNAYMEQTLLNAIHISQRQPVVIDRLWLSEIVYSDVFRDGSNQSDFHTLLHDKINTLPNIMNVMCLPHKQELTVEHFAKLAGEREEMYDSMEEVVKCYLALWQGDSTYEFKQENKYVDSIMNGGLNTLGNFVRYDWSTDGDDMKSFIESIIKK